MPLSFGIPELLGSLAVVLLVAVLVLVQRQRIALRQPVREMEDLLSRVRASATSLAERVSQLEGRSPERSPLHGMMTRRMGALEAVADSIWRDLRRAVADGSTEALAAAATRAADRAERLAQVAAGGRAREQQATLAGVWPRVSAALGDRLVPHTVRTAFAEGLPPVVGSTEVWVQILTALVENSAEAMPGGGLIEVGAAAQADGFACVWVSDTGRGIAPEIAPHVLEPFYTSRSEAGAEGLGLSMVAALVEALGGEARLTSEPGKGTRVEMVVPLLPPAQRGNQRLDGEVLVADDDRVYRAGMARLLESFGLKVLEVDSGISARSRLVAEPGRFAAAVLDVVMPGPPVGEVVAAVRERRPAFPVLLVSGYDTMPMVDPVLALGRVHFLRKPFTRDELFRALRDLFPPEPPVPGGGQN